MSYAYVHSVAHRAGFVVRRLGDPDYDSIDVTIESIGYIDGNTNYKRSVKLDLQLKATAVDSNGDEDISFALPLKNYNDLRDSNRAVPALLVVLFMPTDNKNWLVHDKTL
jgi:hypothetical protein